MFDSHLDPTPALDPERARSVLLAVQAGVPLVDDPWAALGEAVGLPGATVLAEVQRRADAGELREISGVIEGQTIGWDSALVAVTVPEADLARVAAIVSACPTVTHAYERRHPTNLWFTIAMPPHVGVDAALRRLERDAALAPHACTPLRRTHTFKIGVRFDPDSLENSTAAVVGGAKAKVILDAEGEALVRALQRPLPYVPRPFAALSAASGVDERALLAFGARHMGGLLRRYVGTLRHRKLGVRGNGMVVWQVPEARIDEGGAILAAAPEVSHCYARDAAPGFPFRLYSMIHAKDEAAVEAITARLAEAVRPEAHATLFSTHEFKKERLRYFTPELAAWWGGAA